MEQLQSFQSALSQSSGLLRQARDPWWIIGSAAMALHGFDPGLIGDVDILTSERDACALGRRLKCDNQAETDDDLFRSRKFFRLETKGLPLEIMAGLEVRHRDLWQPVRPRTRQKISRPGLSLFVPDLDELVEIFTLFGRRKDLERVNTMRAIR